jgi:hypothetical protein
MTRPSHAHIHYGNKTEHQTQNEEHRFSIKNPFRTQLEPRFVEVSENITTKSTQK